MTKKISITVLLALLGVVGCNPDNSAATREVSKPNPPYQSPGPNNLPGGAPPK